MRWVDSIKETTALSLQELNKAVTVWTFWRLLIYRVAVGRQKGLDQTLQQEEQ